MVNKNKRPQYLVSTDSIGFLGSVEQFIDLWQEHFDDKTLSGVEVIAFKPLKRLKRLFSILNNNHMPVLSFHGKTGGENLFELKSKIIMTLVNNFVENAAVILDNFPQTEFLSHSPYLSAGNIREIILKNQPKKIWIENHLAGKAGVENAIKEIQFYREHNINTLGMLDVYHYVAFDAKNINKNWNMTIEAVKKYILMKDRSGRQMFQGIHFPIGSRKDDSLPIDSMTDEMLVKFAENIIPYLDRVVFENQQKFPGLLYSNKKMLELQYLRNKRIIHRLKKTGIIK